MASTGHRRSEDPQHKSQTRKQLSDHRCKTLPFSSLHYTGKLYTIFHTKSA